MHNQYLSGGTVCPASRRAPPGSRFRPLPSSCGRQEIDQTVSCISSVIPTPQLSHPLNSQVICARVCVCAPTHALAPPSRCVLIARSCKPTGWEQGASLGTGQTLIRQFSVSTCQDRMTGPSLTSHRPCGLEPRRPRDSTASA